MLKVKQTYVIKSHP